MTEAHDPNRTVDIPSAPPDSLDAGLAAAFGKAAQTPRSSLEASQRPVLLQEAQGESDPIVQPHSDAMPPESETGDRYQLFGEIARGGMGAVLRGRDVDLGRDLAVKVLLEKHANNPAVARRFLEEAQIGGQLQHPGVVPVYDIGRFGARPFFTMKLVKGQTLATLLSARAEPTADRPQLLNIALQVAQALAYAHAKGVIHRDLKPANIMVGAFGEVQVMDWGLAKVLAEGGVADEERASRERERPEDGTQIRTARSTGSSGHGTDTEAGTLLGTPAYMPPEQASGDVALLDRRADIFGLGAILCEILTGKPPYLGRNGEEVRRKAANGDLADATARLDACGADAELIALTKECLAPEVSDRPQDAQAVADGLAAYLNGVQERLQAAERARAVALVRASEERKRRRVQLALAAALAFLLLGAGTFAWWQSAQANERLLADERAAAETARLEGERQAESARHQLKEEQRAAAERNRRGRNAEAVAALLGQCTEALRAGDAAKASVALEAARKRSAEGGAEAQAPRLGRLGADLTLLRDLDAIDQFHWTAAEGYLPNPAVVATRTRAALRQFGADPDAASVDEVTARVAAAAVRERLVTALDRLLRQQRTAGVRAALRRVDADPYRNAVRDAVLAKDRAQLVALVAQAEALQQPPGFAAFLGESPAIGVERRRQLLQSALSRRSGDLGLLMTLGLTYPFNQKDGADERLRWCQAAVAAGPTNGAAHNNLGIALFDKGQLDAAIACYHKVLALDPKDAIARYNLGTALLGKGQVDAAIACYHKSLALDPKLVQAHTNLGAALYVKGQVDEAIACYHKALALDPKDAKVHTNLGTALSGKGQVDAAIACFHKAIALDPKNANAHGALGLALLSRGRYAEARDASARAPALLPLSAPLRTHAALQVQVCEQLLKLEARLPALLRGEEQPASARESLDVAQMCVHKRMNAAAARFYTTAFAADAKLADAGFRYNAACSAALAAAGQGEDAAKLDAKEKTRLRQQARDWLGADLAQYTKLLASGPPAARPFVQQRLQNWQKTGALAGIRDAAALAKLSAEERTAFTQLWADVATLLKRTETPTKKETQP